jgi:hypothetical protein
MGKFDLLPLFSALMLAGCGNGGAAQSELKEMQARISSLETGRTALEEKVLGLEQRVTKLQTRLALAAGDASAERHASFDAQDDQGYQSVQSGIGRVLLVLEKLEPYLDGYTVTLRIGNPSSANINGFAAKVSWGPKFDVNDKSTWNSQSKDVSLTDTIPAGSWSLVKFNIGPASAQQARTIDIEPRFSNIGLRVAHRTN